MVTNMEKEMSSPRKKYESPPLVKNPDEDILSNYEKGSSKKIGHGVTDSEYVELIDDGKGVFKTENYAKERAAYLVDRFLNLGLTPPTVIKNIGTTVGSIQRFVEDTKTFIELQVNSDEFYITFKDQLIKLWVFDLILGNTDRHGGNFLIKEGRIYAIDHGDTLGGYYPYKEFTEVDGTGYYLPYKRFYGESMPQELIDKFKQFNASPELKNILVELLTELLGEGVAKVCLQRIEFVAKLVEEKGCIPSSLEN